MRDLNEQLNSSQSSRAKFKQRVAGGAVLLIVLAIFLPFIFNHSHMGNTATLPADASSPVPAPAQNAAVDQTQAQPQPQAQPTVNPNVNTSAAPVAPAAPAEQVAQQNPTATDQSMRSDQPGLTSPQSESAAPAQQPAVQQPTTSAAAPQQTQPVNAVPAQPVQPEQSTNTQPAAQLAVPATPAPAVSANPAPPAVAAKVKPAHAAAAKHSVPSPVAHGNWMVQVGSFSQAEYATKLVAKLRAHGMPAYTQRESNHLVRVYVGPLADQQQAHKIQQKVAAEFQLNGLISKKHV